jgi:hypothetical protein
VARMPLSRAAAMPHSNSLSTRVDDVLNAWGLAYLRLRISIPTPGIDRRSLDPSLSYV